MKANFSLALEKNAQTVAAEESPLSFALRVGCSVAVLKVLLRAHPAAVFDEMKDGRSKRLVPLWERVVRDSENSQLGTEGDETDFSDWEPDSSAARSSAALCKDLKSLGEHERNASLDFLATSSEGVVEVCLTALEGAKDKRLFVNLMSKGELSPATAEDIAKVLHLNQHL